MAAAAPTSNAEVTTTPPHATISKDGVGRKSEALAPVKLSITPEAFSVKFFEANEEKPGLERVSYVVTPHPSKGLILFREPLKEIELKHLSDVDNSKRPVSQGDGKEVRSDLGRPPPCPTLIKFFESPAIAQDDFTVYEAKPTDHGNPLYDADLTPLRRPGAKTVKTVEIRGLHGQIPGEEADAIDDVFFNDENKDPAETA